MATDESQSGTSGKKWSQVSFWEGLETELEKVRWAVGNPQDVMARTMDFVARDQPKVWVREFERYSSKVNAGCGAPDPVADAADEFVVGARDIKPRGVPYLIDNDALQSDEKVLAYHFTKTLWDKAPTEFGAPWGSTVRGLDEGDGWLKVGRRYLPMEIGGVPVLRRIDTDGNEADEEDSSSNERSGTPRCRVKRASRIPYRGVSYGADLQSWAKDLEESALQEHTLPDLIDVGVPDLIDLEGANASSRA